MSLAANIYFSMWGVFNLFFYPHLEQHWSFIGGAFVLAANLLWVTMMVYYRAKTPRCSIS